MKKKIIDLDDIYDELGDTGKFQVFNYILVILAVALSGTNTFAFVFVAGVPKYRCFVPECDDGVNNSYDEEWVSWAIPQKENDNQILTIKSDNCDRYEAKNFSSGKRVCSSDMFTNITRRCSEWVYEKELNTIVNKWNLTCSENQWKILMVATAHFIGVVPGNLIFGLLADKYGRKLSFVTAAVLMSIFGSLQVLSPNYETFIALVFLHAVASAPICCLGLVLGAEMFGKTKREAASSGVNCSFLFGSALIAPISWLTKNWVSIQLITSGTAFIFVIYFWILPESVRWLLVNKRNSEALEILSRIAKANKVNLSSAIKKAVPLMMEGDAEEDNCLKDLKEFLSSKKLLLRVIIVYIIWAVSLIIYMLLSVNAVNLGGNKYLNFGLVMLVGIPATLLAWLSVEKVGSRNSMTGTLLICGLSFFSLIVGRNCGYEWLVTMVYVIGKFSATGALIIVYLIIIKILPTNLRSGGLGIGLAVARSAVFLVPFIPSLSLYYQHLPSILLGTISIGSGLLVLKLPETAGVKMPDTVKEANEL